MSQGTEIKAYSTNEEIDTCVLNHTNEELMSLFTKSKLSQMYQIRFGCKPRSNMTKLDIVRDLRVHIKYMLRNRALLEMDRQ